VSFVSLSAEQIRQMFVDTPLGGKTLSAWVDAAFDTTVKDGIKEELNVGMLQGEGYPKLVKRLSQGFDMLSKEQATTLARTYVQSANVAAMEAVYKQNADVVKRVNGGRRWSLGIKIQGTEHASAVRRSMVGRGPWTIRVGRIVRYTLAASRVKRPSLPRTKSPLLSPPTAAR